MNRISHEIEHGEKISARAEEIWGWDSPSGKIRAERRANYLIDLGDFDQGNSVLEIGCGTGLFTEKVYNATKSNITAIDISEKLLAQAREKLPQINFKIVDAMDTGFEENSFNCIYGSSVLHHLDMDIALKEIIRILKPGGRAVFAEPNIFNPQIFLERNVSFIKEWMGVSPDETAVNRWAMKRMLQDIGYVDAKVFPYDFLHPYTPKTLIGFIKKAGSIVEKIPGIREIAGSVIIYARKPEVQ